MAWTGFLMLAALRLEVSYPVYGLAWDEASLFLAADRSIYVYRNAKLIGKFSEDLPTRDVDVTGDRIFVAGGEVGIYVLSRPLENSVILAAHTPGCPVEGIGVFGNSVWAACGDQIIRYRYEETSEKIKFVERWSVGVPVRDACQRGSRLFAATARDLRMLDLEGHVLDRVPLPGTPRRINCSRDFVEIALGPKGVALVEIRDAQHLRLLDILSFPGRVLSVSGKASRRGVKLSVAFQTAGETRIIDTAYSPGPRTVTVSGQVVDDRGRGLKGVLLLVRDAVNPKRILRRKEIGSTGKFSLTLPPGTYRFDIRLQSWDTTWIHRIRVEGDSKDLGVLQISRTRLAERLFAEGKKAFLAGRYRAALNMLNRALEIAPNNRRILRYRDTVLLYLGEKLPEKSPPRKEKVVASSSTRSSTSPPLSSFPSIAGIPAPLAIAGSGGLLLLLWITWMFRIVRSAGTAGKRHEGSFSPSHHIASHGSRKARRGASKASSNKDFEVQASFPVPEAVQNQIVREGPAIKEAFALLQSLPEGSEISWVFQTPAGPFEIFVNTSLASQRWVEIRRPASSAEAAEPRS